MNNKEVARRVRLMLTQDAIRCMLKITGIKPKTFQDFIEAPDAAHLEPGQIEQLLYYTKGEWVVDVPKSPTGHVTIQTADGPDSPLSLRFIPHKPAPVIGNQAAHPVRGNHPGKKYTVGGYDGPMNQEPKKEKLGLFGKVAEALKPSTEVKPLVEFGNK